MEHHVYFWLKEEHKNEADLKILEQALDGLLEIECVASGMWGVPSTTAERPVTDKSFDYGLSLKFDNVEQHNIYQDHAGHHAFVATCKHFWREVKVLDVG